MRLMFGYIVFLDKKEEKIQRNFTKSIDKRESL